MNPIRAALWLAFAAFAAVGGHAAWRMRESVRLVRASEPLQAQPAQPAASLLIVGDSTAVGTGASTPAGSLAGLLARRHPHLRIVNRAQDGARYRDFATQLSASDERFDTVLVLGGGNDVLRFTSAAALRRDVATAARRARAPGERVVLMPPGNVGNAPFFWPPLSWLMTRRSQALHAAVRAAAATVDAHYVNLYKPRRQDPFAQRPRELHAADGLHPSDAGYRLWLQEFEAQAGLEAIAAR